ncbi:MAG: extensin family protein [Nannocystaceae bacterium]
MSVLLLLLAAGTPPKRPNMPMGWTWPPSPAMRAIGDECVRALDDAELPWQRGPATPKIATPVVLSPMSAGGLTLVPLRGKGRYPMDCHLARALAVVAPTLLEQGVVALGFRTLHEYRTVRKRGRATTILSRHAIGLAVDVFELHLEGGRVLQVEADWASEPRMAQAVAVFADSGLFRTPLTPANDPEDHGDHVHLEAHMRIPID